MHRQTWVPPHCRRLPPTSPPASTGGVEEQLLYLALYRDKVTQHHQNLHDEKGPASPPLNGGRVRKRREYQGNKSGFAEGDEGQSPSTTRVVPSSVCVAAGAHIGATTVPHLVLQVNSDDTTLDAQKSSHNLSSPKTPNIDSAQESSTAYIASVSARAAFGGVTEEHLEAKQLGQLFDQYCAHQEKLDVEDVPRGSGSYAARHPSCGSGVSRRGAAQASPQRNKTELLPSPRGLGGISRGTTSRGDTTEAETAASTSDVGSEPSVGASKLPLPSPRAHADALHHAGERRKVERLFNVITNSKVRVESFAEQRIQRGPAPSHIEGFSQLHLMRLYHGPWRIDV